MLEHLTASDFSSTVVRYANPRHSLRALRELEIDDEGIREMLAILHQSGAREASDEMLDNAFAPRGNHGAPFAVGRYSDGNWPVCYTALDESTAREEIIHHRGAELLLPAPRPRTAYYCLLSLHYSGLTIDLRPQTQVWPDLLNSTDYQFCQSLAREAIDRNLSGFVAPAVRRPAGSNVPVFLRTALTGSDVLREAIFRGNPALGEVDVVGDAIVENPGGGAGPP